MTKPVRVLPILVVLLASQIAVAQGNQCGPLFSGTAVNTGSYERPGALVLSKISTLPPRLERILRAGLLRRYWNDSDVVDLATKLVTLPLAKQSSSNPFGNGTLDPFGALQNPSSDSMTQTGFASLVSEKVKGDQAQLGTYSFTWRDASGTLGKGELNEVLNYTINSVASFKDSRDQSGRLGAGNTGQRPKGLDMEFGKFMVAVFRAIESDLQAKPHIKTVEIGATSVMNEGLYKLLLAWGFQEDKGSGYFSTGISSSGSNGFPDSSFGNLSWTQATRVIDPNQMQLPGIDGNPVGATEEQLKLPFLPIWGQDHPDIGKNWFLELDLK